MQSPTPLFPDFRWRFATMTPSEGLLKLPVLLGVTRCFANARGADDEKGRFLEHLAVLQDSLGVECTIDLVRTRARDIIRNSGQYWAVLGLIDNRELTPLGEQVADGRVTPAAFAAHSVGAFTIPHQCYDPATNEQLVRNGILFHPLLLILETIEGLRRQGESAHLSMKELQSILVPGSVARLDIAELVGLIVQRRHLGSAFRDVFGVYRANDYRTLREFPLYLCNLGLLERRDIDGDEMFFAVVEFDSTALSQSAATGAPSSASLSRDLTFGPDTIERAISEVRRRARPNQTVFRRRVSEFCQGRCVISGESLPSVLEAAHLRSVECGGSDHHSNGILLRVDLHRLYDTGQLRISSDGELVMSAEVRASSTYSSLPSRIELPSHVDRRQLSHRFLTSC